MLSTGIVIKTPENSPLVIRHLLIDFNGTMALDGKLLPQVSERLTALSKIITISVLTADTYGTASGALADFPLIVQRISTGEEKKNYLLSLKKEGVAAVGNGRNDVEMLRHADLSIAVMGGEGVATELFQVAQILVTDIQDALDLLLFPKRLTASLRK